MGTQYNTKSKYRTLRLCTLSMDNLLSQITSKKFIEPHDHDCIEFFYVIQGTAQHILNGTTFDIAVGDAFILTPGDKHWFTNQTDNFLHRDILINLDYFKRICNVYDPCFSAVMTENGTQRMTLSVDEIYSLEQSCRQLSESLSNSFHNRNECIIVTTILNTFLKQNANDAAPGWLKKLVSHISTPAEFIHPIASIVSLYPFSTSYICRVFKKHYGITISRFFNLKKIEYAKILLLTTDYTIEKICEILGFNSVSYFCKLFKKITGTTPSTLRQVSYEK